ncbi:hypothetical protein [Mesorhizobium sp.]|uniref:hypothetical protein n=1 Tax=Mesorhizobium sp. TaxID=1871066 RepID=UPI0025C43A01|nr:hypothetical protein [Mesorhizobium sp.]
MRLDAVRVGLVADADLLDADDRAHIVGGLDAVSFADRAIQSPAFAGDHCRLPGPLLYLAFHDVVGAEEIRRIEAVRIGVDVLRRALLHDPAILQKQDVVGSRQRLALIMRDQDGADFEIKDSACGRPQEAGSGLSFPKGALERIHQRLGQIAQKRSLAS